MDKAEQEYIQEKLQDLLDETFDEIELPIYIMATDLNQKEKRWANKHIGVHIVVDIIP